MGRRLRTSKLDVRTPGAAASPQLHATNVDVREQTTGAACSGNCLELRVCSFDSCYVPCVAWLGCQAPSELLHA